MTTRRADAALATAACLTVLTAVSRAGRGQSVILLSARASIRASVQRPPFTGCGGSRRWSTCW
jgi:hypothetical protein